MQHNLVHLGGFRDLLRARGLTPLDLFDRAPWETLDREELLVPVAYALHGFAWHHDVSAHLDAGDLIVREESGHLAWDEIRARARERNDADLWVLYSPWQVFRYARVLADLSAPIPLRTLATGLDEFFAARARSAAPPPPAVRDLLHEHAVADRTFELLLIRVQNWLLPEETGRWRAGAVMGLTDDAYEWTVDGERAVDWCELLVECGLDEQALAVLYEGTALQAQQLDPNERLFVLLDGVERQHRERLKGTALLAQDWYLAARMLRRWHARTADEPLPDVDDVGHFSQTWKTRWFGTEQVRGNRAALPAVLDMYGLYPYRVQLIAEGASEIAMLREILALRYGLTFDELGVVPTDLGGADVPTDAERLLTALRFYANYFLLVFDNEGRAQDLVRELVRRGVIEGVSDEQRAEFLREALRAIDQRERPVGERIEALQLARERARAREDEPGAAPEFVLWREDLEADNFTHLELCEAVNAEARTHDLGWQLTADELTSAHDADHEGRGVASVLVELGQTQDPPLTLGKPELAKLLASYAVANPQLGDGERPVLALAEHLVLLASADRMLAGELRQA